MAQGRRSRYPSHKAGVSVGTGFAGIVAVFPDGVWKSVLIVLSPTITIIFSATWYMIEIETAFLVKTTMLHVVRRQKQAQLRRLRGRIAPDPDTISKVETEIRDLDRIEQELSRKRIDGHFGS